MVQVKHVVFEVKLLYHFYHVMELEVNLHQL